LFVGFNLTCFPQISFLLLGMPRRYHTYPPEFQVANVCPRRAFFLRALGYLRPFST